MKSSKKHTLNFHRQNRQWAAYLKIKQKYVKDGTEKSYEQATRIDKTDKVSTIVEQLINLGENYLDIDNMLITFLQFHQKSKNETPENISRWISRIA